jgi:hypothetical protein
VLKSSATALTAEEPACPFWWRSLARQGRIAAADLRNVPRYLLRALVGVAAVCGLVDLWGLRGDGKMPAMSSLFGLDPYCISSPQCIADDTGSEARWKGLSPALAILERVNPAVAKWVRLKHDAGLLVFDDQCRTDSVLALAKYDTFRGRVLVNRQLFSENDGTIAVTFCHEYRHSRQNLAKFCQHVLSYLFVRGGDPSIIENDALIYEQEAYAAIFGNGRSREKEIAAWEAAVRPRN